MPKKRTFRRLACAILLGGCLAGGAMSAGSTAAQQPGSASSDSAAIDDSRVATLISQLGAGSFQTREAATAELLSIGIGALPALNETRETHDPEVRRRVRMISQRLAEDDLQARITAFLEAEKDASLPGWNYARASLGDGPVLRELFVEITRKHPQLAASLDGSPRERMVALQSANEQINAAMMDVTTVATPADAIALLLATTDKETPPSEATDATLLRLLTRREITVALEDAEMMTPLRRLLGQWIVEVTKPRRADALFFAMQLEIEEGRQLAATTIRETEEVDTLQTALQTIARFGSPADAVMLRPLLDDQRAAGNGYAAIDPAGRPLRVQLGDVAMATVGILNDRQPRDMGFPAAETHSKVAFNIDTLGFPVGEAGDAARARVRAEVEELIEAVEKDEAEKEMPNS